MLIRSLILVLAFWCLSETAAAKRSGGGVSPRAHSAQSTRLSLPRVAKATSTGKARCTSCAWDQTGRIQRSSSARSSFQRKNPCPSTGKISGGCPGYVIDHRQPLKRGGHDSPANMQWQTRAEAAAKDRVE